MKHRSDSPGVLVRAMRFVAVCATGLLGFLLISLHLPWQRQMVLGAANVAIALAMDKLWRSRVATVALMAISCTATLRYLWWRVHMLCDYFTDDSVHRGAITAALVLILFAAEAYTVAIMALGYMQTAWPLERKPVPLPADESLWPHVDLLIPTYNEPLSLVRYTALASLAIDYPPEKLHVYILDDGAREDFEQFAAEAGVGYIARQEHDHAKAGNINHALGRLGSEFVAIFDCDHVPTRSFLQMTLGWMMADARLAMLQTPHHFYSPDPFERNLLQYKSIPNEGELFYGIVQDGNDFWNATFFCGSCALLRRAALDEAGGIATETVTEDAHTSLRMQKLGYNTAYINIPQAAGLATETLAAHVGQRIRWARGMIQILRIDNPLFGRKMSLAQRLCYFNAMAHFLYAVPRLVFLLSPLAYLLLGRTIIPGYWAAILAYALPHLLLASLTNSRVQGRRRHSFWNEIYETVLAPYILAPTLMALINPRLGKFNVTGKGGTLAHTRFDSSIARPTKLMLLLNFCGALTALHTIFVRGTDHTSAVVTNLACVVFNMVILGVAAAVACEQKQRRSAVRVEVRLAVAIRTPDGRSFRGVTTDMSVGGASIRLPAHARLSGGECFRLAFPEQTGDAEIDARAVELSNGETRVAFDTPAVADQEIVARALYSRADAWLNSAGRFEADRPLVSLARVVRLSCYGIFQILRAMAPSRPGGRKPDRHASARAQAETAALIVLVAAGFGAAASRGYGAQSDVPSTSPQHGIARSVPKESRAATSVSPDSRQSIAFVDMGITSPIELRGPHSFGSVGFTLAYSSIPRAGSLRLIYRVDPRLDLRSSSIGVLLNRIPIATILPARQAAQADGSFATTLSLPDSLLVRSNTLTLEFKGEVQSGSGNEGRDRFKPEHGAVSKPDALIGISPLSSIVVEGGRVPWQGDLSQLPLPILDPDLQTATTVRFVFLSRPAPIDLQAAGIVASWLGLLEGARAVRFSAAIDETIPAGNAVVFADGRAALPPSLNLGAIGGPIVALRANPNDEMGSLLVVAGDNGEQLLAAAQAVSLSRGTQGRQASGSLAGRLAMVPDLPLPEPRASGDAPRWMRLTQGARFTGCEAPDALETDGSHPIPIYFHLPPGAQFGDRESVALGLRYRYNARSMAAGSLLRVSLNGAAAAAIRLQPGMGNVEGRRVIEIPVEDFQPFGNTVAFQYDFPAGGRSAGSEAAPPNGAILCDSTLDLNGVTVWPAMPNLELFANAGFPFTQYADLHKTAVAMPDAPDPEEIVLFLSLMSHFGAQTGFPALRVTVTGPETAIAAGRDYLVLGTAASQPLLSSLSAAMPVTLRDGEVLVRPGGVAQEAAGWLRAAALKQWNSMTGKPPPNDLSSFDGSPDVLVEEAMSPASPGRSIVIVEMRKSSLAGPFVAAFLDRSQTRDMNGAVSLLIGSKLMSFPAAAAPYRVGDASLYMRMKIWFAERYLLLLLAVTLLTLAIAKWICEWMARLARERLSAGGAEGE